MDEPKASDAFYPGREPNEIRRPAMSSGKIDPADPRGGVPPNKFGTYAVPMLTADKRQAVMMMLYPPEALRDASIDVIREAVQRTAAGLLETIVTEIYRSYTSDPVDGVAARSASEALAAHADAMRQP